MERGSTSRSGGKRVATGREAPIHSVGSDVLCSVFSRLNHFDLVRCSAVCLNKVVYTSSLMRDMYYKMNPPVRGTKSAISSPKLMKRYLEDLAIEEYKSALSSGSAEVLQWQAHPIRAALCRMKRGFILTGVGDKVIRLWSAHTCKYMDEFHVPTGSSLVDYDFDENKIVGLTDSQVCIWRRHGQRGIFQSREGLFTRGLCMSYVDPEVVIGCDDGRARVFDMYSRNCTRIIRLQSGPLSCLTITPDQLIAGGSTFGSVAIADLTSGERLALLRSSFSPTGMKCLSFNARSHLLFAGSTSGYAHCWDLRTLKPLWEKRVSPNVIYSTHHMLNDTSILAVGGVDGVLRILNQSTGEILKSYFVDRRGAWTVCSKSQNQNIEKKQAVSLAEDLRVDTIPRNSRPPITCLAVGMKKIVTTHGENFVRLWRFSQ
ncbi:F-box/WD-40 repeat-containing protein [Carex littledalei]|uniref:F-box/WD-40 repeat-containing protein n=1 Tax=Carex littledalei TaxID=544730 RepID=A0A833RF86_9POAL|nr:F-box/WD-40 repeat-containing protein [Carex littledalei]